MSKFTTREQIEEEWVKGCDHVAGARENPALCFQCKNDYHRARRDLDPVAYEREQEIAVLEKHGDVGRLGLCPECGSGFLKNRGDWEVLISRTPSRFGGTSLIKRGGDWVVHIECIACGAQSNPVRSQSGMLDDAQTEELMSWGKSA